MLVKETEDAVVLSRNLLKYCQYEIINLYYCTNKY